MQLGFTGDISFNNDVPSDVFSRVAPRLRCPMFINFESVLVEPGTKLNPARDKILLWSPAERFALLEAFDVAVVCLANNHIGDYGNEVACRTLQLSSSLHPTFGAGTVKECFHRYLLEVSGTRLALLAYVQPDCAPLVATETRIGPREFSGASWREDLAWARGAGDHVIVALHWGDVHTHCPRPDQVAFARSLVDDGADLVIGSHSHTAQGYERHRGKYIFYSLGNFLFPDVRIEVNGRRIVKRNLRRNRWGLVPVFEFTQRRVELAALHVVRRTSQRPELVSPGRKARQLGRFSEWVRSPELGRLCAKIRERERRRKRIEESLMRRFGWLGF
jgi:poly-gamma-glutamate capsule biosynthesis protein CapA/YwtB (metallophosphatase superfamily)